MKDEIWKVLAAAEQEVTGGTYRVVLSKAQLGWLLELLKKIGEDEPQGAA